MGGREKGPVLIPRIIGERRSCVSLALRKSLSRTCSARRNARTTARVQLTLVDGSLYSLEDFSPFSSPYALLPFLVMFI